MYRFLLLCFSKEEHEKEIIWREAEICMPSSLCSYDHLYLKNYFTSTLGIHIF